MAIKISSRKPTNIGFTGTTGGSLGWINQAGASGRAAMQAGSSITTAALSLQKAFDDDLDQGEIRQQVQDMKTGILDMSMKWNDSRYDPKYLGNKDKGFWQTRESGLWKDAWGDLTFGKDDKAVSEFGPIFGQLRNAAYEDAGIFGRKQRWSRLKAKDDEIYSKNLEIIQTSSSIAKKQQALEVIDNMYTEADNGLTPHRDINEWNNNKLTAKNNFDTWSLWEGALGQKGKSLDINDIEGGYTADEYDKAIIHINNNKTIKEEVKKKLITNLSKNMNLRIKAESRALAVYKTQIYQGLETLLQKNLLSPIHIDNAPLDTDDKEEWHKRLKTKTKEGWQAAENDAFNKISSRTWDVENDIIRDKEIVRQKVIEYSIKHGIEKMQPLLNHLDTIYKNSPTNGLIKDAWDHANNVFRGGGGRPTWMSNLGSSKVGKALKNAAADKEATFKKELQQALKDGYKNDKLSYKDMLDPLSDKYIVDTVINNVVSGKPNTNQILKEVQKKETEEALNQIEESSWMPDWLVDLFRPEPVDVDESTIATKNIEKLYENYKVSGSQKAEIEALIEDKIIQNNLTEADTFSQTMYFLQQWKAEQDWSADKLAQQKLQRFMIYGRPSVVNMGVTEEEHKFFYDSKLAFNQSGDHRNKIVFDEGHPGYNQKDADGEDLFVNGEETWFNYENRIKWMNSTKSKFNKGTE